MSEGQKSGHLFYASSQPPNALRVTVISSFPSDAHYVKERLTRSKTFDLSLVLDLFNYSIDNKTNNIGEFIAIIESIKYILKHPEAPRIIYSDSITAITWYRNKRTAS